ncbi:MAG: hypothetical protein R2778_01580 [Saprospiraceae bacterium]
MTLLGQNVDSYKWENPETGEPTDFADLLAMTAHIDPNLRVRFSTSHPKDMTDKVLHTMATHENMQVHSLAGADPGNSRILEMIYESHLRPRMVHRTEWKAFMKSLPEAAVSTTSSQVLFKKQKKHQDTLSIVEWAEYSMCPICLLLRAPWNQHAKTTVRHS